MRKHACEDGADTNSGKPPDHEGQRRQPQRSVIELHKCAEEDNGHLRLHPSHPTIISRVMSEWSCY